MNSTHFESLYPPDSRFAEIEKVLAFVKTGQSCQVVGVPGVGRSNLLRFLAFNRNIRIKHLGKTQSNFHFLYLDFAEMRGKDLYEVNKFIFLTLGESFKERGFKKAYEEAARLFRDSLALADPLVLFQNLKKTVDVLTNQLGLTLVFLFDRFEEYLSAITPEFFSNLRLLRNIAKYRFSVVFALSRPLETVLPGEVFGDFYEFFVAHLVFLPLLDEPGINFRLKHLAEVSGKKLAVKIKEKLLVSAGGHGKLTRVCAEILLSQSHLRGKEFEEFLSSQTLARGALFEILSSLNLQEQDFLKKLARGENPEENMAGEFLFQLDLLKKTGGQLTFTIPLLANYLKNLVPAVEKIYFRVESNEILKGEGVISDGLSPAEFRLLKFFLQNPGKVCEREEIIQAVWPEAKSQEGISNEAIDQMIFRLRKKIEENPQNPQHLQTLKGRGFRFSP